MEARSKVLPVSENTELNGTIVTKYDVALVAARVIALYFFVKGVLTGIQSFVFFLPKRDINIEVSHTVFIPFLLWFVASGLLWYFSCAIAAKMVSVSDPEPAKNSHWTQFDLWGLGFSLSGLFILATAVPVVVDYLVLLVIYDPSLIGETFFVAQQGLIVKAIVQFIIGCSLLFGWQGLVGIVMKLRSIGQQK